jgi:acetyltransferase-like isoleucine patch superfamily enzyme
MGKIIQLLKFLNLKTIYFNLKYFPVKQAVKLPVLLSNKVYLREVKGRIHFNCEIKFGLVQIGYGNVGIFDKKKSRTIWEVYGDVTFCGNANIGHGSKIIVGPKGSIIFGTRLLISAESSIIAYEKIQFGNNCFLSWDTLLMDTDFHSIKNEKEEIINSPKPIIIGNHVWIGCRSVILKGSIIPDNSIIAINSLVNKELMEENCIYGGSPVKCIKEKISWEE